MADIDQTIEKFSHALLRGVGVYFLGSGISKPSGLPDWQGLIEPFATRLGLHLGPQAENLPLIAQYVINSATGNRGFLVGEIKRRLGASRVLNDYHEALRKTNIRTIWTTNFDTLIEDSFQNSRVAVFTNDSELTSATSDYDLEVLKLHGCIRRGGHNDLVITTEDYEDFEVNRPALVERLRHDLLHRTVLFVGYSYSDPNIATVLVQARRLAGGNTREHLMILKKETASPENVLRQQLWITDLKRVGINSALVDSSDKIKEVLLKISVKSRGPSVFPTGSHTGTSTHISTLAANVGTLLASVKPIIMIDGQSSGIGRDVLNAFGTACVNNRLDIPERIRYFPNPYSVNPAFANNRALLDMLKQWRGSLLRATHTVLAFDGGMGTETEVELARALGCHIVPVPDAAGGLAERLLGDADIRQQLDKIDPSYGPKASSRTLTALDIVECIKRSFV